MLANRVRVGVVGCGEAAQIIHLPAMRDLSDKFTVTALLDVSRKVLVRPTTSITDARQDLVLFRDMIKLMA